MKTKTIKQHSATEKFKLAQIEAQQAQQEEMKEIAAQIDMVLKKSGYALSARMIMESGKAAEAQVFLIKV